MATTQTEIIEVAKAAIKSRAEAFGDSVTLAFIEGLKPQVIASLQVVFPKDLAGMDSATVDLLYRTAMNEYVSVNPISINASSTLRRRGHNNWLTDERTRHLPDDYIKRYVTFLRRSGRPDAVIQEIENSSEKILGNLGDPKSADEFYVKGLVVGSVQSGKTANFNAVINRAIDAGYSLIIVLSGIMEDLRAQTQRRIENDVIGESTIDLATGKRGDQGVGKVAKFGETGDTRVRQVFPITSYKKDFVRTVKETDFSLNNKNILVCKKNTGVLTNLLIWLDDYLTKEKHDIPLLLIDDEADNASLNNMGHMGREYASKINGHIRALLGLFTRKTYLGYTATPFANVLADRNSQNDRKMWTVTYKVGGEPIAKEFEQVDNLFPEDFIVLLDPPSNYIGAKQVFETVLDPDIRKIPVLETVFDFASAFPQRVVEEADGTIRPWSEQDELQDIKSRSSRRLDPFPSALPTSLEEAVQCFILSMALRLSRKSEMIRSTLYNPHHTMLVHVSRFIPWQTRTRDLLASYVQELESRILNDLPTGAQSVYAELERIWNRQYANIVTNIRSYLPEEYRDEFLIPKQFKDIKAYLIEAVKGIEVKAINSETGDRLIYSEDAARNGRKYIAVGGNRLSRGFTLEGLTINYFLRDTNFSDTLLQMGRWFGYRPGYIDCCKLFTTPDAIDKFNLTTRTIEELENEFRKMERNNKSPRDFELRVRKHPGTLKITRPSILKNTKDINWSYQDKLEQTTAFVLDPQKISSGWKALTELFDRHRFTRRPQGDFYVLNTDPSGLFEFLDAPNTFYNFTDLPNIKSFISMCVTKRKLTEWTIAVKTEGDGDVLEAHKSNLPDFVRMSVRSGPPPTATTYRSLFTDRRIFHASQKSANIVTTGRDFSILLSREEIDDAEKEFRREQIEMLTKSGVSEAEAARRAKKTFPERIYRERMPDTTGLMVIYIIDPRSVFLQKGPNPDDQLRQMVEDGGFNLECPIFGYAIGFPPIIPDPGGVYAVGKYDITEDEGEDEFDADLVKSDD
jgi:hypothetical protein